MGAEAIFIGYRREDTADVAGRIYDALSSRFGKQRIFRDIDNLRPGVDFGDYIRSILPQCRVALILIGPNWANSKDNEGRPRLQDPNDWVRMEVEASLAADNLDVVPVLVNGAQMPRPEELPPSLQPLLRRHAAVIRRDPDFHDDVVRMVAALRQSLRTGVLDLSGRDARAQGKLPKQSRSLWLAGAAVIAASALLYSRSISFEPHRPSSQPLRTPPHRRRHCRRINHARRRLALTRDGRARLSRRTPQSRRRTLHAPLHKSVGASCKHLAMSPPLRRLSKPRHRLATPALWQVFG